MSSSKYIHRQEPITQWAPDIVYNTFIKTIRILRFCFNFFKNDISNINSSLLSLILKNLVLLKLYDFIFLRRLSTENCGENKECRRMCNRRKPFLLRRGATYLLLIEFERKKTRIRNLQCGPRINKVCKIFIISLGSRDILHGDLNKLLNLAGRTVEYGPLNLPITARVMRYNKLLERSASSTRFFIIGQSKH